MTGERFNVREASIAASDMGEEDAGSSGSAKTVAYHQRSELELGTAALNPETGACDQPQEDAGVKEQPSDRPIVVGDGRTDHRAKGPATGQREQSTHAGIRTTPVQSVSRSLLALSEKAKREPAHRFRGLSRLISLPMLHECYHSLRKRAATGTDEVSWHDYGEGLSEKLENLHERLRTAAIEPALSGVNISQKRTANVDRSGYRRWKIRLYKKRSRESLKRSMRPILWTAARAIDRDEVHGEPRNNCSTNSITARSAGSSKPISKAFSTTSITTGWSECWNNASTTEASCGSSASG